MTADSISEIKLAKLRELRTIKAELDRLRIMDARKHPGWETPGSLAKMLDPTIVQTPALELIDRELVHLADDPNAKRLMIFMPPQEGKSERISHRFPEWLLRFNPDLRIAIVSYADEMARRWGAEIKMDVETFNGDDGGVDLGLRLRADSKAAGRWHVAGHKGGVYCCGVAGSLTGKPVDWLIIDDPIKDLEHAYSLKYRERAKRFWRAVAIPRFGPNTKVVVVQTRWHEDDFSGWQLAEHADRWKVISIPAEAESEDDPLGREIGEMMISARGNRDWEQIRKDVGEVVWAALYQQRPSPADGGIFKRSWWKEYTVPRWVERPDGSCIVPGADEVVCSWDMAFKDLADSDYVCGQVWARFGLQAFLVDQIHDRLSFVETRIAVRQLSARWPQATAKYIEDKANGTAVINSLSTTVSGMIPVEPDGSKLARARAISPFVEAGQVFLPSPELCPWVGQFIEEHASFPNGVYDDQVDATSQAINRMLLNPILLGEEIVEPADLDPDLGAYTISQY